MPGFALCLARGDGRSDLPVIRISAIAPRDLVGSAPTRRLAYRGLPREGRRIAQFRCLRSVSNSAHFSPHDRQLTSDCLTLCTCEHTVQRTSAVPALSSCFAIAFAMRTPLPYISSCALCSHEHFTFAVPCFTSFSCVSALWWPQRTRSGQGGSEPFRLSPGPTESNRAAATTKHSIDHSRWHVMKLLLRISRTISAGLVVRSAAMCASSLRIHLLSSIIFTQ